MPIHHLHLSSLELASNAMITVIPVLEQILTVLHANNKLVTKIFLWKFPTFVLVNVKLAHSNLGCNASNAQRSAQLVRKALVAINAIPAMQPLFWKTNSVRMIAIH